MVIRIKGDVFVFQLYFKFLSIDFRNFFKYLRSVTCHRNERKKKYGVTKFIQEILFKISLK